MRLISAYGYPMGLERWAICISCYRREDISRDVELLQLEGRGGMETSLIFLIWNISLALGLQWEFSGSGYTIVVELVSSKLVMGMT